MTWHRVDDRFPEHAKLQRLERDPRLWADALALWLAAACYCRRAGIRGHITMERLVRLTPMSPRRARQVADALVDQAVSDESEFGLFERVEDGYVFHDWDDYGPSSDREDTNDSSKQPLSPAERARRYRENRKRQDAVTAERDERHDEASRSVTAERDAKRDARHVTARTRTAARGPARAPARAPRPDPDPDPVGDLIGEGDPKTATPPARVRAREEAHPPKSTFGLLRAGYGERYETHTGDAWMSAGANHTHIERVATWCERQAELRSKPVADVVTEWLDALFGIERLRKHRWPWKWAAEDPAKVLAESVAAEPPRTTAFGEPVDESWMGGG